MFVKRESNWRMNVFDRNLFMCCVTVAIMVVSMASCHVRSTELDNDAAVKMVQAGADPVAGRAPFLPSTESLPRLLGSGLKEKK